MAKMELDCTGLACPAPVLKTKEVIDAGETNVIAVKVDNAAARENVSRFLGRFGFLVNVTEDGGNFIVTGSRDEASACEIPGQPEEASQEKKILVLMGKDKLGEGDDELGYKLALSFISTLKEMGSELWRVVFLNGGVKFTVEGSPVLDELRGLLDSGVSILVCGTCLTHFGLIEKKQVGETTNMLDIITSLQLADQTIDLT